MQKYRLTLLFLAISAMTIGTAAWTLNHLAARSVENNIVRLTTTQSARDARLIAELVSQLLAEGLDGPVGSPSTSGGRTEVNYAALLEALNVVELGLYDLDGAVVWSSRPDLSLPGGVGGELFAPAASGKVASGLVRNRSVVDFNGVSRPSDVVESYIPLVDRGTRQPVRVLQVSRDVTADLASQIGQAQSTILKTTLFSLVTVFVILLSFVLAADLRIWRSNDRALRTQRDLNHQLDLEKRQLQHLNETKSRFLSTVSHELNTPLTSVVAFANLVLKDPQHTLTPRQVDQMQIIRRNGQHLTRLIGDLLDMSRVDRDAFRIEPTEFEATDMIGEAIEGLSHLFEERKQVLNVSLGFGDLRLWADRGRIVQVITNVLSNASKYSPEGTEVLLRADSVDGSIVVTIQDHGIGISDEDQRELFTSFFRADNAATRAVGGTGIGLVIAKEIVELHGGQISLTSEVGVGTTVNISVPLAGPRNAGAPATISREATGRVARAIA